MEPNEGEFPEPAKPTKEALKLAFEKHKDWLDTRKQQRYGLKYDPLKKKASYYSVRDKWEKCESKEEAINKALIYVRDAPASTRPALVQLPAAFSHRAAPLASRASCCLRQGKKPPASPAKTKAAAASSTPARPALAPKSPAAAQAKSPVVKLYPHSPLEYTEGLLSGAVKSPVPAAELDAEGPSDSPGLSAEQVEELLINQKGKFSPGSRKKLLAAYRAVTPQRKAKLAD